MEKERSKKRKVEDLLDEIGIPLRHKGYAYLVEVVIISENNPWLSSEEIYKKIARKYQTTRNSAERNIRTLSGNYQDEIKKFFKVNYKISNEDFIKLSTREIVRREEEKMLENRMVIDDEYEEIKNYDDYLENLLEEDDRRYEDEIFYEMEEK